MDGRRTYKRIDRRDWDAWYADAKAYHEKHGDLLVPAKYVTPEGHRLGQWINFVRMKYKGAKHTAPLYPAEIEMLEAIGMVWSLHDCPRWDGWLKLAEAYYAEHGDLLVPEGCRPDGHQLDEWVSGLRVKYRKGLLSEQQVKDVERLGMVWEPGRTRPWEEYYNAAAAYYAEHGDLLVPKAYVTADGLTLGKWINMQRCLRNHPGEYAEKKPLSAERISKLEAVGMVWDTKALQWEEMYAGVKAYYEKHGRLPGRGVREDGASGRSLGGWLTAQRKLVRTGAIDRRRAERLRALGISRESPRT